MELIKQFRKDEEGVTMVEYGLLAALITIVSIVVITALGTNLQLAFQAVCDAVAGAVGGAC
jgi:pilus assembly protein Flp/PilA